MLQFDVVNQSICQSSVIHFEVFNHKQNAYLKKFNEFLFRCEPILTETLNNSIELFMPLVNVSCQLKSSTRYFFLECSLQDRHFLSTIDFPLSVGKY